MKTTILTVLALCVGVALGFVVGERTAKRDVTPKVRQLLRVWFGTEDLHRITDKDAQAAIDVYKDYLVYDTDDNAICWEVLAFCKLNGLWSGKTESASDYTKRNLTYFFKAYREEHFSPHYSQLADKLYRDLTSDTNRFDYTVFDHPPAH